MSISVNEYMQYIGKTVFYKVSTSEAESVIRKPKRIRDKMTVEVEVIDIKSGYGHILFNIKPVCGTGSVWVRESSIRFVNI